MTNTTTFRLLSPSPSPFYDPCPSVLKRERGPSKLSALCLLCRPFPYPISTNSIRPKKAERAVFLCACSSPAHTYADRRCDLACYSLFLLRLGLSFRSPSVFIPMRMNKKEKKTAVAFAGLWSVLHRPFLAYSLVQGFPSFATQIPNKRITTFQSFENFTLSPLS